MSIASMKIFFLTFLIMVLLVKISVQSLGSMQAPVKNSLHQILQASATRSKRSAHDNVSGNSIRHQQRNLQHKLQLLESATNTSEPGYATVIKEEGKLPQFVCSADQWACPYPHNNLVSCIPLSKVCDYVIDCPNAEDEEPIQCSHIRAQEAKLLQHYKLLEDRLSNLERGYMQQSCELNTVRESVQNHRHTGRSQLVRFDQMTPCQDFGFTHNFSKTKDHVDGDSVDNYPER